MINNNKDGELRSQSPFKIIEEQFKDFNDISVRLTDIGNNYAVFGEDMYAELYKCVDGKWLLDIDELLIDSPTKMKNISSAFSKALENLNKY